MEANDNGLTFAVVFFESESPDAMETLRVGGFASSHDAIQYAIGAHQYAKDNGLFWCSTEIVFE